MSTSSFQHQRLDSDSDDGYDDQNTPKHKLIQQYKFPDDDVITYEFDTLMIANNYSSSDPKVRGKALHSVIEGFVYGLINGSLSSLPPSLLKMVTFCFSVLGSADLVDLERLMAEQWITSPNYNKEFHQKYKDVDPRLIDAEIQKRLDADMMRRPDYVLYNNQRKHIVILDWKSGHTNTYKEHKSLGAYIERIKGYFPKYRVWGLLVMPALEQIVPYGYMSSHKTPERNDSLTLFLSYQPLLGKQDAQRTLAGHWLKRDDNPNIDIIEQNALKAEGKVNQIPFAKSHLKLYDYIAEWSKNNGAPSEVDNPSRRLQTGLALYHIMSSKGYMETESLQDLKKIDVLAFAIRDSINNERMLFKLITSRDDEKQAHEDLATRVCSIRNQTLNIRIEGFVVLPDPISFIPLSYYIRTSKNNSEQIPINLFHLCDYSLKESGDQEANLKMVEGTSRNADVNMLNRICAKEGNTHEHNTLSLPNMYMPSRNQNEVFLPSKLDLPNGGEVSVKPYNGFKLFGQTRPEGLQSMYDLPRTHQSEPPKTKTKRNPFNYNSLDVLDQFKGDMNQDMTGKVREHEEVKEYRPLPFGSTSTFSRPSTTNLPIANLRSKSPLLDSDGISESNRNNVSSTGLKAILISLRDTITSSKSFDGNLVKLYGIPYFEREMPANDVVAELRDLNEMLRILLNVTTEE